MLKRFWEYLFIAFQRLLPARALGRVVYALTRSTEITMLTAVPLFSLLLFAFLGPVYFIFTLLLYRWYKGLNTHH